MTFERPFAMAPFETPQPAGTYRLVTDDEEILGLSFLAFHRTATMLALPAIGGGREGGPEQLVTVRPEDLEAALERDGKPA